MMAFRLGDEGACTRPVGLLRWPTSAGCPTRRRAAPLLGAVAHSALMTELARTASMSRKLGVDSALPTPGQSSETYRSQSALGSSRSSDHAFHHGGRCRTADDDTPGQRTSRGPKGPTMVGSLPDRAPGTAVECFECATVALTAPLADQRRVQAGLVQRVVLVEDARLYFAGNWRRPRDRSGTCGSGFGSVTTPALARRTEE